MRLNFPVFIPVRGADEVLLVNVSDEMPDCLPVFTTRELAELYTSEEGSGLNLVRIEDRPRLADFVRDLATQAGVTHFALNPTFRASAVTCGTIDELIEE